MSALVGFISLLITLIAWLLPLGGTHRSESGESADSRHESGAATSETPRTEERTEEQLSGVGSGLDQESLVATEAKSFSPVTFTEFMDVVFSDTLTDLQRDEFFQRHLGRLVIWQGNVADVSENSDGTLSMLLALHGPSRRYRAFLEFGPEYKADLLDLERDSKIKVACKLADWGVQAELDGCKLLQVARD